MTKRGFTLIEMMVAVGLFAVIMTISVGTLIGVFNTNRKSQSIKAAMDNLSLAIESMSREMRFGYRYSCNGVPIVGTPPTPTDCANAASPGTSVDFTYQSGQTIGYRWNQANQSIERWTEQSNTFIPITSPDIKITGMKFFVVGSCPKNPSGSCTADSLQPKVLILVSGIAGDANKPDTQTSFTIQTQVTQRKLDF